MERYNLSGSGKRSGKETQERRDSPDFYQDLTELTSQVQMMSDSLAACRQMSKCRPLRKCDVIIKGDNNQLKRPPSASTQTRCPTEEKRRGFSPNDGDSDLVVSFMINDSDQSKEEQKKRRFDTQRETRTRDEAENTSVECLSDIYCQKLRDFSSAKEPSEGLQKRSSKIGMYNSKEVDPQRMIEIIERELETLKQMTPPVALLVSSLSESIFHCKDCYRCSEKISTSLPWILSRIQKLIKYVTTKRHGTYIWPNDYSYLRLVPSGLCIKEAESSSSSENILDPLVNESLREFGHLEKFDADEVIEGRPGVQILLNVETETQQKRFFKRAYHKSLKSPRGAFPVVHLRESIGSPVVQILQPSLRNRLFCQRKNSISSPKELAYSYRQVTPLSSRSLLSLLVQNPAIKTSSVQKFIRVVFLNPVLPYEEQIFQLKKLPITLFKPTKVKRRHWRGFRESSSQTYRLNESKSFPQRNLFANAPQIVQDLLKEAEEEEMQTQSVRELESEVKALKDLMLEVHKNQMELSKILLEKGVYSQPIIKLTDPNMLEEENQTVRKVSEAEELGKKNSTKALQSKVDDLKQKCLLKNRVIVTLLKGLQSNVPKEWWEEMVSSMFDESKLTENFDPEKVSEFIRQSSLFLMDGEKASRESIVASRSEEHQSEEEPNAKKVMGTSVQDHLTYHDKKLAKMKCRLPAVTLEELLNGEAALNILTLPVSKAPQKINTSIRKLENQVSLLNMENERLWHEIYELKGLFKDSIKGLREKKLSHASSNQQLSDRIKTSGKIINLTIQIAPDKDIKRFSERGYQKSIKVRETSSDTDSSGISKSSRFTKDLTSEGLGKDTDSEESNQDQNINIFGVDSKFRSKSERRRSENDLNYLDDLTSTISDYRQENEKLKALLREKTGKELNRPGQKVVMMSAPLAGQEMPQSLKPVTWVPSKYVIPEVSASYQAGPSRKPTDVRCLLQNPSHMELAERQSSDVFTTTCNERELQTIPENDHANSSTSASVSRDVGQIIQHLRTRVRTIHKDVTVLKSKNDRIDKMLDKLIDDTAENNKNFEAIGNNLNNLKNRLG